MNLQKRTEWAVINHIRREEVGIKASSFVLYHHHARFNRRSSKRNITFLCSKFNDISPNCVTAITNTSTTLTKGPAFYRNSWVLRKTSIIIIFFYCYIFLGNVIWLNNLSVNIIMNIFFQNCWVHLFFVFAENWQNGLF